jgi:hypothetical protein
MPYGSEYPEYVEYGTAEQLRLLPEYELHDGG